MQPADMLTPEMINNILPFFGVSIILNFVLLALLIFRPIYQRLIDQFQTVKIGVQMAMDQKEQPSQHS